MLLSRFYHPAPLNVGQDITLTANTANHVQKVLRLPVSADLILFDGSGDDFDASIASIEKREVRVKIKSKIKVERESSLNIHLAQALVKSQKMDLIIQKSVELGVTSITPLITERCEIKLNPEREAKRLQHWQSVIISACEQCGRSVLPSIHKPIMYSRWLAKQNEDQTYLILSPTASGSIADLSLTSDVHVAIGPEGGFTDVEVALAKSSKKISIGSRVLRTETAGLATLAILQSHFGDM